MQASAATELSNPSAAKSSGQHNRCSHLVLEEVEVEVALKAAHKGDGAGLPVHLRGRRSSQRWVQPQPG